MGLFDKLDDNKEKEEVQLRAPETQEEANLEEEVEESLVGGGEDSSDSSGSSGSMLPGVDTGSSSSTSSSGVDMEDIHRQNKKIIELLKEIKNSGRGTI